MRTCPHPRCSARIDADLFACRRHWFQLPAALRARIVRAYRSGDVGETLACYDQAGTTWG